MAFFVLGKKLSPAKKAWKCLMSTLRSKLHHLKKSKAMNKTTTWFRTLPRRKQNNNHHHYYEHERYVNKWHQQKQKLQKSGAHICMDKPLEEIIEDVVEEDKEDEESTCKELVVLYGVDARAQDFIDEMKRQLALERQESDENFKAMLDRGT